MRAFTMAAASSPFLDACENELKSSKWNAGKPVGGPESFDANPWRFDANNRFTTERDGCNGRWQVRADASAPGGVVLRMDWEVSSTCACGADELRRIFLLDSP